jgi:hypothetical protein
VLWCAVAVDEEVCCVHQHIPKCIVRGWVCPTECYAAPELSGCLIQKGLLQLHILQHTQGTAWHSTTQHCTCDRSFVLSGT